MNQYPTKMIEKFESISWVLIMPPLIMLSRIALLKTRELVGEDKHSMIRTGTENTTDENQAFIANLTASVHLVVHTIFRYLNGKRQYPIITEGIHGMHHYSTRNVAQVLACKI